MGIGANCWGTVTHKYRAGYLDSGGWPSCEDCGGARGARQLLLAIPHERDLLFEVLNDVGKIAEHGEKVRDSKR